MNRVRYEVKLVARTDGTYRLTVYDDYWDNIHSRILDEGFSCRDARVQFFDDALKLLPRAAGWYAVEVDLYPFGEPVRVFPIPGRNLRYVSH